MGIIYRNGFLITPAISVKQKGGQDDIELLMEYANFYLDEYLIDQLYTGHYVIS